MGVVVLLGSPSSSSSTTARATGVLLGAGAVKSTYCSLYLCTDVIVMKEFTATS